MKTLSLSVIVTCFNRDNTILRALESLRAQSDPNFDTVVVDDASTDNSVDIIESFIHENPSLRIRLYKQRSNLGQNAAINRAVSKIDSHLIAFLDSDDVWAEKFVEEMRAPFREPTIGFAYCRVLNGPKWNLEGENIFEAVLKQGYLSTLGALVVRRNSMISISPLPERLFINDMCQDDQISFELSRRYACRLVPLELLEMIGTNNSMTRNKFNLALGWFQFFNFYKSDIQRLKDHSTFVMYYQKCFVLAAQPRSLKLVSLILADSLKVLGLTTSVRYTSASLLKILFRAAYSALFMVLKKLTN